MAFTPMAWAQFSGGTGTEADPYQISSTDDWIQLCANVNNSTNGDHYCAPDRGIESRKTMIANRN